MNSIKQDESNFVMKFLSKNDISFRFFSMLLVYECICIYYSFLLYAKSRMNSLYRLD